MVLPLFPIDIPAPMNVISLDLSVVIIMLLVWSLYFILKKSFFDPINKILSERDASINGALREAQDKLAEVDKKSLTCQDALKAARLENYRIQESFRTEAMRDRAKVMAEGRRQAEASVSASRQDIQSQVSSAKQGLEAEVNGIADGIVKTIFR